MTPPPSPFGPIEDLSDEENQRDLQPSLDLKRLMKVFTELFPENFFPAAPHSPPSEFTLGKTSKKSDFTKMVLLRSSKRALKIMKEWMDTKRDQGKAAFSFPPARLPSRSSIWYDTGEALGLGVPASFHGDYSSLVDASRWTGMGKTKVFWSSSDMDHLLKGIFRAFEVFNFLDWTLGSLGKKLEASKSTDTEELVHLMSCIDKALRDGSNELAALFSAGILKKRAQLCSFLSNGVTPIQKAELLFAPLSTHLFPQELVKEVSSALTQKATKDLMTKAARKVLPSSFSAQKLKESRPLPQVSRPFRGRSLSRGSTRPVSRGSKKRGFRQGRNKV
ncbi:uncharacterized protein LOC135223853 isoform X2 [Macrobrachium nipponense]|uniref:uncharacterized protein LOC135223853 isoform X2 n=1 Tax=Macrobrachium nipponense TaxID=159736 RepID=UPI0030C8B7BF